ncbi:MAG TPA: hypothetical protein VF618_04560 [Thermoanaerobaculia bacterium]
MKNRMRNRNPKKREEGSALLVSLMVMVGLSLLGLGFVAISETESIIAVNERNFVQAQVAAEAGARAVIEMFQDAPWANTRGLLPPNNVAIKTQRNHGGGTLDYYKGRSGLLLFDAPFRVNQHDRFYGDEEHADVLINSTKGTVATTYLTNLNTALFPDGSIRITDIRVYAPPMPGATKNAHGFYDNSTRYGVATVSVTAEKLIGARVAATRTVKAVVAETPFPIVDGAIETSGSLVGQGNFHVYWGKVLSEKEMQLARPAVGMPWFDAKEQMNFEYGYDSSMEWTPSTGYAMDDIINATGAAITANPRLAKLAYVATNAGTSDTVEPAWGTAIGATFTDNGITWRTVPARQFRIDLSDWYSQYNWLYSLLGVTIPDPWLHARSRGDIQLGNNKGTPCNSANPHPCDFDQVTWDPATRYSNVFQKQITTDASSKPESIEVFFPTMDFEFWKAIAQGSNNEPGQGIYYFDYDETTKLFTGPGGAAKPALDWMNAKKNGLGPGFYFFDSANGKNPQFGKGGTLTDAIKLNAGAGGPYQMQGYIYLNAKSFGTTGSGNLVSDDIYPMPGEPFRDTGYREVDVVAKKFKMTPTGAVLPDGDFVIVGENNAVWDYQDLNDNGVFDVHVAQNTRALTQPDGTVIAAGTVWLPVAWTEGCTPPDETKGTAGDCSEPHEPYLNFTYPAVGNPKDGLKAEWHNPTDVTFRRAKVKQSENVPITCKSDSPSRDCTSNAYDDAGALVRLAPLLWGAMYNEGGYDGSGNATYYGALLMRGDFNSTGTPDVFFNECLAKGCLENQLKLQRVMITSFETDQ